DSWALRGLRWRSSQPSEHSKHLLETTPACRGFSYLEGQLMPNLIPADTHKAAKRGFVRTAAQSLASIIPTSAVTISLTQDFWVGAGLGAASAVATAILAGAASYFSILSKGIPEDY